MRVQFRFFVNKSKLTLFLKGGFQGRDTSCPFLTTNMILDYLRRVSNLRLFEPSAIQPQHRDPKIQWDPHYEKHWREERAKRHTVSNDNGTNDQETPECYSTPPATQASEVIRIDVSESEDELVDENEASITTYLLDCTDKASEPRPSCIYVQPAVYQKKSCDDVVADSESTSDAKHRFEMLLNILAHPNSEMHDNDSQLLPQAQIPKQSGKTAFLFEFLERVAVLKKVGANIFNWDALIIKIAAGSGHRSSNQ